MDAGFLDMLHDAGDVDGLAVADAVHVHFGGVGEVLVDQDRVLVRGSGDFAHVAVQGGAVVEDFHGAATKDIAGADDDGVADALGDVFGLVWGAGDAVFGLADAEFLEEDGEAFAVFGDVDGVGAGAEDGDVFGF